MSRNNEYERGFVLPRSIERIRQTGEAVVGMFFADPGYIEHIREEKLAEKGYEDKLIIDLGDRVLPLDSQDEIESAKSRHPSSRGYL